MEKDYELRVQETPELEKNGISYFSFGHHDPVQFLKAVCDYRSENGYLEDLKLTEAMVKHNVASGRIDMEDKALIELSEYPASAWITYFEEPASATT